MTPHSAVRAIAGGLGVVAGIFTCAAVAAGVIVALGLPAESRADDPPPTTTVAPEPRPTELVVALGLGDPVLQAGVVRDGEVIIARVSKSTSPAISPGASVFPAFASSTSSPPRGASSERCGRGI